MNLEKLTTKTSALLRTAAVAIATGALSLGLVACATAQPEPTEAAQEALESQFGAYQDADEQMVESLMGSMSSTFEEMGVTSAEFFDALKGKFTYSIDSAKEVSADEVVITVTTENVDIAKVIADWTSNAQQYAMEKVKEGMTDQAELTKALGQKLVADLKADDAPTATETTELTMKKDDDGEWKVANADDMTQVLFPGFSSLGSTLSGSSDS